MKSEVRYAVISDVHSNLEALVAVLDDIRRRDAGHILFLGDAVGYGPDPVPCIDLLRETADVFIAGNHDRAVAGLTLVEYFNDDARAAVEWTRQVITYEGMEFLSSLPLTDTIREKSLFLVHSTPKDPGEWNYILTLYDAEVNFQYFSEHACLIGHSHIPFIIERYPSGELLIHRDSLRLSGSLRYIINAGSVGQPRDGDPRASYVLLDGEDAEIIRLEYDIRVTQRKMKKAGLPLFLVERLQRGV